MAHSISSFISQCRFIHIAIGTLRKNFFTLHFESYGHRNYFSTTGIRLLTYLIL